MQSLEDVVYQVVSDLTGRNELFTALDVSNRVKQVMPSARHRQVRDAVRQLFENDVWNGGYNRSPITVELEDGSQATAMLYHPSFITDLDASYNAQKRSQTAVNPQVAAGIPGPVKPAPAHWGGALPPIAATKAAVPYDPLTGTGGHSAAAPTATVSVSATVPLPTARNLWEQLFQTQPTLFPSR